jgi:putative ABC transport system ATP-binding protein
MALESTALQFKYNNQKEFNFNPISLTMGESALLLGPSGSGKTTLLHLLAGLLVPLKGDVNVAGKNLFTLNAKQRDAHRGKQMGIIFQRSYFLPYLSIGENLKLAAQMQGLKISSAQAKNALEKLNVAHVAQHKPANCSVGEQQRASIARAILHEPKLILADEPTSALDDINAEKVTQTLLQVAAEQKAALLIVTHDSRLKNLISKTYAL